MSEEFRIALVAEGPTDFEVIQAALKAVLTEPFVLIQLQPESTLPKLGGGWCGVVKWCHAVAQRHHGPLIEDPTLQINPYDLIVIHLDVDVTSKQYSDCGETVENWVAQNAWASLPCALPCPPVSATVNVLIEVLESWLGQAEPGERTLFCLPAQSSGTWLAAAVMPATEQLLVNAECNPAIESRLAGLPRNQRIKKKLREYRIHAPSITAQWEQVKQVCTQAEQFEQWVQATVTSMNERLA